MERPVYFWGPPVGQQTISVTRYLNPAGGYAMMGLIYLWIGIQARIDHDPVNEVIHHGGDAVDAPKPIIKARRTLRGHHFLPQTTGPRLLR